MKKVRYALIGFGGIAEKRIAKEGFGCDRTRFNGVEYAELVGAFDRSPARREAVESLQLKWYESLQDIWDDETIDGVFIATNNTSHAALTLEALEHGKHVIVEKPIATAISDAEKMVDTARRKNLSLSVDHMMVNNVFNVKAAEIIRSGKLGKVTGSCFHMEFIMPPEQATSWRCSKVEEMGGPIGDVGSHCFYMAEFLLQKRIEWVAASYMPKMMPFAAEDGAYIKYGFNDGSMGSVRVSFAEERGGIAGSMTSNGYEIYGEDAVLRGFCTLTQLSGAEGEIVKIRLEIDNGHEHYDIDPGQYENIYQPLIRKHALSVLNNTPDDASDGLHNLKLCISAHKSAQENGKKLIID